MVSEGLNDPEVRDWLQRAHDDLTEKIGASAMSVSILTHGAVADAKFWVELGASIMMDKPLIIAAYDDVQIPPKLRSVADEIVLLPEGLTGDAQERMKEAIGRVLAKIEKGSE